jgi:hypothetical protein
MSRGRLPTRAIHGHTTAIAAIATPAMIRVCGMRISREQSLRTQIGTDPFIYEV